MIERMRPSWRSSHRWTPILLLAVVGCGFRGRRATRCNRHGATWRRATGSGDDSLTPARSPFAAGNGGCCAGEFRFAGGGRKLSSVDRSITTAARRKAGGMASQSTSRSSLRSTTSSRSSPQKIVEDADETSLCTRWSLERLGDRRSRWMSLQWRRVTRHLRQFIP